MTYDPVGPAGRTVPVVVGDWAGNAAGKALCVALGSEGIIVDSTTNGGYAASVLATAGLRDYWRLGESSGSAAADAKGTNPGTYVNGVTLGTTSFAGSGGTGITLDGSTGYINVPHNASLNVGDTFSLELWLKRSATQNTLQPLISKQAGGYCLRFDTNNTLQLIQSNTANIVSTTAALTDTASWHHVVCTKAGATVHIYLDGVDQALGALTNATIANTTVPLFIGTDVGPGFYAGGLDEVALYNTAISQTAVSAHWALR